MIEGIQDSWKMRRFRECLGRSCWIILRVGMVSSVFLSFFLGVGSWGSIDLMVENVDRGHCVPAADAKMSQKAME